MKTGSFRTPKSKEWPGAISIARSARGFRGPTYKALAPGPWFNSVSKEEYERRFTAQLHQLDPEKVLKDLHKLVHPYEPVLLCWEVPPFTETNWCHRRMVASWLERMLDDVKVEEVTPQTVLQNANQLSLFESEPDDSVVKAVLRWIGFGKF